jgi:D-ribose pyranose/furanose isomerase RbsD
MKPDEELSFLRAKVAELENKSKVTDIDLALIYGLPPVLERLLRMLMNSPRVTNEMIEERLDLKTLPKVAVFRLRKYMQQHGINVQSKRHLGYWLDPKDKELIAAGKSNPPSN